ncbi:MAG: glycerol-3-phosphate 1-O-acyltransferase PlsY [Gammaproteobacteria bacterium]|nr:glycerol-3-phosphate 1-O-acyltransferase PlsY [Gammaproteobacteria bacterium]
MAHLQLDSYIAIVIAYLIGSISSAIVTCKIMGLPDPRNEGSGNPGTTNVLRIGGKKAAIITLMGDVLKGVIPVLAAKMLGFDTLTLSLITLAAFLGHLYPVFFRFQGGKGVATAFGCLVTLAWPVGVALLVTWVLVAAIFRYSSLAALTAAIAAPFFAWYFTNSDYTVMTVVMSLFLIYRHHKNIHNLISGKEDKIGKKKK